MNNSAVGPGCLRGGRIEVDGLGILLLSGVVFLECLVVFGGVGYNELLLNERVFLVLYVLSLLNNGPRIFVLLTLFSALHISLSPPSICCIVLLVCLKFV